MLTDSCASTGAIAFGMTWRRMIGEVGDARDVGGLDIAHAADRQHLRCASAAGRSGC